MVHPPDADLRAAERLSGEPFQLDGYRDFRPLRQDGRHVIHRARGHDGRSVVVKTLAGEAWTAGARAALRHEHEVLAGLELPGVVRAEALVEAHGRLALVTLDAGEEDLAHRLASGPLEVGEFLTLAVEIARSVAAMHGAGRIHRDINPSNIVLGRADGAPTLIDFEFATTLKALEPGASVVGTLEYVAPEQTGRLGRSVDKRADLYALGATLYEMLLGAPPFQGEPLALVHAHLARSPVPPSERSPHIPQLLSALVLKLLAKEPEERYQTAEAVIADLSEARERWLSTGRIEPFPLARTDVVAELRIPDRTYGRDAEARELLLAFERASSGAAELLLVTGSPGIGKSALVGLVRRPIAERRGVFIAGKFDQLQRVQPYSALADALRELVRQILAADEATVTRWRTSILAAVGDSGQALLEVVPDLAKLVGPQPPLSPLGPDETAHRLLAVFQAFIRTVARADSPIVLFLDDLQWIDPASLRLLEAVLGDEGPRHLLVVGAYRDEEVGPTHPLTHALRGLREKAVPIRATHLGPLARADVARLCAETFARPPDEVDGLAASLSRKTAGNPFFLRRTLMALHAAGLIRFDHAARAWAWDVERVDGAEVADNVVALMARTIGSLPSRCGQLLGAAACIGNRFELALLAGISRVPEAEVVDALFPALEEGLLLPVRDAYQAPRTRGPHDVESPGFSYRFVHDRVQQAAYGAIDEEERRRVHLAIGRRLSARDEGHLLAAVDHLNLALPLLTPAERLELAELDLRAGGRAKRAGAYRAALDYLAQGRALAGESRGADFTFAVERESAECAYLAGEQQRADETISRALPLAPSARARAELLLLRVSVATLSGDVWRAIAAMREGLAELGVSFPAEALEDEASREMESVARLLRSPGLDAFRGLGLSEEPRYLSRARLLAAGAPAAFATGDGALLALTLARLVRDAFEEGHTEDTPFALAAYALVLQESTGDHRAAFEMGRVGVELARRRPHVAMRCVTLHIFATHVNHWNDHLRTSVPLFREAVRFGLESGEHKWATFANMLLIAALAELGHELREVSEELEAGLALQARLGNRPAVLFTTALRQFVRCMQGETRGGSFEDDAFREHDFVAESEAAYPSALGFYWTRRLIAAVILRDYPEAVRAAELSEPLLRFLAGERVVADHAFYAAVAFAAAQPTSAGSVAPLARVRELEAKLARWAELCPANAAHRRDLVEAELARVEGDLWRAAHAYDRAIEGARASGFLHDEALASERAGQFYLGQGTRRIAGVYLQGALDAYARWGASAKVQALTEAHRGLVRLGGGQPGPSLSSSSSSSPLALDAESLVKASQAISGEMVLERLLQKLMEVVIQTSGAERASLLVAERGTLEIAARGHVAGEGIEISLERCALDAATDLPSGIVLLAWRGQERVVLGDAARQGPFLQEPVVRARGIRSVLCLPVTRHGGVAGVLYLENSTIPQAFGQDRAEIVGLLAAQLAISLDNARLFAEVKDAVRMRDDFLAMLSHELRNPLATITSAVHVMQRAGSGDPRLTRLSEAAGRQAAHMTRLLDELLDAARIRRGKIALAKERTGLTPLVESAVEQVQPQLDQRGHRLSVNLPDERIVVEADPVRLTQAIVNLLDNAAKYTPHPGELSLTVGRQRDRVVLRVRDPGVGIPAVLLPRIFDPFVQADRSLDRKEGGLGIGLTVTRTLVELHGGTVEAYSDGPGKGSEFVLRLPLLGVEAPEVTPPSRRPPDTLAPARRRVLLVEDNADVARSMVDLLEIEGHDVEHAASGAAALSMLASFTPDVVLIDLGMPEMDGLELARRLRANPATAGALLVALTGYGREEDHERTRAAGLDHHLVKPPALGALRAVLAAAGPRA